MKIPELTISEGYEAPHDVWRAMEDNGAAATLVMPRRTPRGRYMTAMRYRVQRVAAVAFILGSSLTAAAFLLHIILISQA